MTVIDNPMSLEIEVGRLKVMDVSVDVKLSIDRGRGVNIEINSADYDADEYVFIRMSPTDYKRFRNFLKETDSMLNSLHSNRQIAQSFLEE
ncbi:MAG: hypothetical protein KDA52_23935 [Planctomycetaceae bacterium]|nr:hypothetical protein [Planctomycetaceae bacterium]